jgi:hypothetical protein
MLCARDAPPLVEEVQDPKGPISLALGSWRYGGGYSGGEGWGLGVKERGVAYFLPQTCADIYHTGVFQKCACCSYPLWDKKANNFKILMFQIKKKHVKDVFCLEWLINSESSKKI